MAALEESVGAGAATMASGAGPLSTPIQMATGLLVMPIPIVILQGLLVVSLVTVSGVDVAASAAYLLPASYCRLLECT
jgi:hypothetical protein